MRRTLQLGTFALVGLLMAPGAAWAQADTDRPLPNVMLLIDTSGSMEYRTGVDALTKKPTLPKCSPDGDPAKANEQSRWTELAAVLTGEFPGFACVAEDRSSANFVNEFSIGGKPPYDKDYYIPHHRIVSQSPSSERCVTGPDTTKWPGVGGVFSFPDDAIRTHLVGNAATACSPINGTNGILLQTSDGLLDVFRDRARFGLMTFDSLPDQRTGVSNNSVDAQGGFEGMWSYYNGWRTNGNGYAKGKPELCTNDQVIEVGARNPAAPPWEGRLIAFGEPSAALTDIQKQNDRLQRAILAVRPYGATPLAGLMSDAEYFFTADSSKDPTDPVALRDFGPMNDPYVAGGCRDQFIILLTDGVPNLDLRDGCKNNAPGPPDGTCPFKLPSDTAYRLSHPADARRKVQTFVVGFAFSQAETGTPSLLDCKKLTGNNDSACANPSTDSVRACCEMARIAYNGNTSYARFADNKQELRRELNDILSRTSANTTSRTIPVFSASGTSGGGYSGGAGIAGYNILSSFRVSTGGLWQGVLERQRYTCNMNNGVYTVTSNDIDKEKGDSFHLNVASGGGSPRTFLTVEASAGSDKPKSRRTLRNSSSITDGLGSITSTPIEASTAAAFYNIPDVNSMDLAVGGTPLSVCGTIKAPVSVTDCKNRILRWYSGQPPIDATTSAYTREDSPFGSIFHSTPAVVGAPSEYLRDESYTAFADKQKNRVPVVYTSTTDGQLHAFKLGPASSGDTNKVESKSNNELWAFVPPAVLPGLKGLFPGIELRLLDIPPIVRDVVYDRKRSDAISGAADDKSWKTVLTTGFGPSLGGYFALDVTNPIYDTAQKTGPNWLWQITTDSNGRPLFGTSATPTITTLFYKDSTMPEPHEIAVAILPGGDSAPINPQPAGGCPRGASPTQTLDGKWKARAKTRCYSDDDPARSVTVVRLDNGQVIRRFHQCKNNVQQSYYDSGLLGVSTCVPFDSPITGVVMPFPNGTGQVATRAFVGDRDGVMWRLDMSDIDPSKWKVELFFDGYSPYPNDPFVGEPVVSTPVAALDELGNLVMVYSTGDQEKFQSTSGMRNVIWSLKESPDVAGGKIGAVANWHLGLGTGESITSVGNNPNATTNWTNGVRVSGPLSLFNGGVYFTTYVPPPADPANACNAGSSVLWGVHYTKNTAEVSSIPANNNQGDAAPIGILDVSGTKYAAKYYDQRLIFGAGIQRLPACYDPSTVSDPYLGYGTGSTGVSNLTPPQYQLVVQTGINGQQNAAAETKFEVFKLPTPTSATRITSWAAVVE